MPDVRVRKAVSVPWMDEVLREVREVGKACDDIITYHCPRCGGESWVPKRSSGASPQPRNLSFELGGCPSCGHLYSICDGKAIDLTPAQADELRKSEAWGYVRKVVEDQMHKVGAWG